MIKTEGLILKEQSVGESDKLVTVLTNPLVKSSLIPVLKYTTDGIST